MLLRALAALVLGPAVDDRRRAVAGVEDRALRAPVARHVDLLVAARDVAGIADGDEVAAVEQHRPVAEALDGVHVVRDEQDRAALRARLAQRVEALALERAVAHGEHLVDQQQVGVHVDHDREGQAHLHARRVVLELQLGEALELGELDDRVVALARLRGREPEHHRVDEHVVARGEVGVEADAQLDEGRDPAAGPDLARVGPVDAGHALHERGLAAAVAADDPEELARADVDRHGAQRVERLLRAGAERMQRTLLERVHLLVGKAEGLGDVPDRQRHA